MTDVQLQMERRKKVRIGCWLLMLSGLVVDVVRIGF